MLASPGPVCPGPKMLFYRIGIYANRSGEVPDDDDSISTCPNSDSISEDIYADREESGRGNFFK
jgi:hypothetical protein